MYILSSGMGSAHIPDGKIMNGIVTMVKTKKDLRTTFAGGNYQRLM